MRGGEMPPWGYRLLYQEARLDEAETGTLLAALRTAGGGDSIHHGNGEEDDHNGEEDERDEREN